MKLTIAFFSVLLLLCGGCAKRSVKASAPQRPKQAEFLDLAAGWRLSVVKPEAGQIQEQVEEHDGKKVIALRTSEDFQFSIERYSVSKRLGGGVRLHYQATERHTKDTTAIAKSAETSFLRQVAGKRYIRLVYLVRLSESDHNMAILGTNRVEDLERLTAEVRRQPSSCTPQRGSICFWVPVGIAVRPEGPAS